MFYQLSEAEIEYRQRLDAIDRKYGILHEYSDDQPRADDGKWTDAGGGSDSGSGGSGGSGGGGGGGDSGGGKSTGSYITKNSAVGKIDGDDEIVVSGEHNGKKMRQLQKGKISPR